MDPQLLSRALVALDGDQVIRGSSGLPPPALPCATASAECQPPALGVPAGGACRRGEARAGHTIVRLRHDGGAR